MNTTQQGNRQDGRLLRRSLDGRILGGVAAGLARYFSVDVTHVRIALVALSFLGGAGVPLYLAAWVLIPADGSAIAIADEVLNHVCSHLSRPAPGFPSSRGTRTWARPHLAPRGPAAIGTQQQTTRNARKEL